MSRRTKLLIAAILLTAGVATVVALQRPWGNFGAEYINVEFDKPDAFVSSERLSQLPAAILKVPVLRDLLTEDFAFYYEQSDTRLSVEGAVRRIAFEHELTLTDRLLAGVLDAPADLALWRGPNGKLRYWMLDIKRNALGKLVDSLAKVGLSDSQLRIATKLRIDGDTVPVYALHLNSSRTLLFASHGEHTVVLSDAGLLFGERKAAKSAKAVAATNESEFHTPTDVEILPPDELTDTIDARIELVSELLSKKTSKQASFLAKRFQLETAGTKGHRLMFAADFLSFGYQAFFPGVEAVRFDFNGSDWSSQLLAGGASLAIDRSPLWRALPGQAAACAALPMDWKKLSPIARAGTGKESDASKLLDALQGPAGICWYAKSGLATPLFVARFKDSASAARMAPDVRKAFEQLIGAQEFRVEDKRFPVEDRKLGGATALRRVVSSPYGNTRPDATLRDKLSAAAYFPVTLVMANEWLAFSPDEALARDAAAVAAKRYPSGGDGLSDAAHVILRIHPSRLAQMLQAAALEAVPENDEPVFHGIAKAQLVPRLAALGKHPPIVATLTGNIGSKPAWHPLNWTYERK